MALQCGLLGRTLGHSYSPKIHSLLGEYEYRLYEKKPEELEAFLTKGDWDGLNVTIPYKKDVIPYCAGLSSAAQRIGSVNTLVRKPDGTIFGDNTDAYGFWYLLQGIRIPVRGKKVLILGNGGACAAVRYVLEQEGTRPVVISRRGPDHYGNLEQHRDASLIVNTTPVGMYPEQGNSPLDLEPFPDLEAVLDIIYNPARTALMMQAEKQGILTANGLSMLAAQAKRSSDWFLQDRGISGSRESEEEVIGRIVKALESEMHNLILIGMPGCGKTSVARILGEKTGKEILEMDELFTQDYGISPAECITSRGEPAFRRMETELLKRYAGRSGCILSTGGGCVTVAENYPLLHQNGEIFWIRRDLHLLPSEGRPLSQMEGAQKLFETRRSLYERFADYTVLNSGTPEETADRILRLREGA
ncbi:MAG: shikimate kinase [Parasporobacterium sp.]|nr:shikimate kinase [Parasporobacterium sp.]